MRRLIWSVMVALALCAGPVCVEAAQNTARSGSASACQRASGELMDLNQASAAQLESLPGLGVVTAERIIAYREEHGGFKKTEELMNVRGIGERNFLRLRPLVTAGSTPRSDARVRD
jgi:competence protein ComEA